MSVMIMRTGQQGLLIKDTETGKQLAIDLYLSNNPKRLIKNVPETLDLSGVSLLFGTHDHEDHIDRKAWKIIAGQNEAIRFIVPKFFEKSLPAELGISPERFIFMDENEPAEIDEVRIEAIAAAHEFLDTDEAGLHPYLMYVITFGGVKLCHMGDTCLYEGIYKALREKGPFDALFPPINGRDAERLKRDCIGNMTYQEAADLTGVIKPGVVIPGHYDMFDDNGVDPLLFTDYMAVKYPGQKVLLLEVGKWFEL